jgi:uncharacterized protein YecE (DUF72 family)
VPQFVDLARKHDVAIVYAHSDEHPEIADVTAGFVYARLQKSQEKPVTGYAAKELDGWADRAKLWAGGKQPDDLPLVAKTAPAKPRDVFVYFISGAKVRNPAAAMALIERLDG